MRPRIRRLTLLPDDSVEDAVEPTPSDNILEQDGTNMLEQDGDILMEQGT